jgi:hypothetical protein
MPEREQRLGDPFKRATSADQTFFPLALDPDLIGYPLNGFGSSKTKIAPPKKKKIRRNVY